jgi:hypothetical protein
MKNLDEIDKSHLAARANAVIEAWDAADRVERRAREADAYAGIHRHAVVSPAAANANRVLADAIYDLRRLLGKL